MSDVDELERELAALVLAYPESNFAWQFSHLRGGPGSRSASLKIDDVWILLNVVETRHYDTDDSGIWQTLQATLTTPTRNIRYDRLRQEIKTADYLDLLRWLRMHLTELLP